MTRNRVLIIFLLISAICRAEYVPVERASIVASNFFYSNDANGIFVNKRMSLYQCEEEIKTKSLDDTPSYYIFQGDGGMGFVIVAADDVCQPILGYSFDSTLPENELPENFKGWLDGIDRQIRYARENNIEISSQIRKQWQYTKADGAVKELPTAKWNQWAPYNDRCPMDEGERSLTGCVATATAIVMRYHKWPKEGIGETEDYYTSTKDIFVPSRYLNHSYDWNNMPMTYGDSYTTAQAIAVSVLMADVGAAYKADYTNSSTGAWADISVLYRNFGYASSIRNAYRKSYTDYEWKLLLKKELDANCPILYSGHGTGGHQFVIDGYSTGGFFRINWGWGGYCDGYFSLNNLTPDDNNFNDDQTAVIGMRPPVDESDRISNWLGVSGKTSNGPIRYFEPDTPYEINLELHNFYPIDFKGDILFAVTDRKGNIKEELTEFSYKLYGDCDDWSIKKTVTVNSEINVGDRIRAYYRGKEETEWSMILLSSVGVPWEICIAEEYYLHEITAFEYNNEQKRVKLTTKDGATIKLLDPEGNDVTYKVEYDYTSPVSAIIDTDNLVEGKYKIVVSAGSESLDLLFSIIY